MNFSKRLLNDIFIEEKLFLEKIVSQIKESKDLETFFAVECDIDFIDKEILIDDLKALTEFTKCNYDLDPFACDGSGGVYVILNNKKVGYIDSEGRAGIVANNLNDFFGIVINCGHLSDYTKFERLKDKNKFLEHFNKSNSSGDKEIIKRFVEKNHLENDVDKIYDMFKNAVMTEPKLFLIATSDDYEDYEQLFLLTTYFL